ncbi:MAG: hypothetical protein ACI8PB_000420 [Desulforhopalus sp.]
MKIRDSVILSVSISAQNGAILLIDGLELSINQSAPFQTNFQGMITYKLISNSLKLCDQQIGCGCL